MIRNLWQSGVGAIRRAGGRRVFGIGAVLLLGLFFAVRPGNAESSHLLDSEVQRLFEQGNKFFREANEKAASDPDQAKELYQKAVLRFERMVSVGGIQNGFLFYNIGNAYFRMKDIGRAILNYRRAEQYLPHDINLKQNLAYARARRQDRVEEQQRTQVLKTLFFWHYDLSRRARWTVFLVLFNLSWLVAGLLLYVKRNPLRWGLLTSGVLALLFLVSVVFETVHRERERLGVVLTKEVKARKGDSVSYERSFENPLHAGTEFRLIEDRGEWYHVELMDGRRCWLPSREVGLVERRDDAG